MRVSLQTLVLVALSLEGTLAQPAHRHQHKHRRELTAEEFNNPDLYKGVNWAEKCKDGACDPSKQAAAPEKLAVKPVDASSSTPQSSSANPGSGSNNTPASTSASTAPSSSASSSSPSSSSGSSTGSCSDLKSVWQSKDSSRNDGQTSGDVQTPWTKFGQQTNPQNVGSTDSYLGNVGSPYGSNMLPLSNCDVSSQKYSITFTNADSKQIKVALWNKGGSDGKPLSGASLRAFWTFPLEAGQSAAFAIDDNSQVAFSQVCDRNTYPGSFDCTWGEADFGDLNTPNNGGSGYDRSSIQNSKGNTGILDVCVDGHDCSTAGSNNFVSDKQASASGNLYVPPGQPMHLKVKMG